MPGSEASKEHTPGSEHGSDHEPKSYIYFVDGKKYESEHSTLTGLQIKSRLPDFDTTFALMEESRGDEPDRLIKDEETVSLSFDKGPRRFYTVPPATFG